MDSDDAVRQKNGSTYRMSKEQNSVTHQCFRCGDGITVGEDQWFRHNWNEEPPREKIQKCLDEGRDFEDWFSDGGMFCRSCHADFLAFTGVDASA